jgi:protein-glucosylgalactosylhydroxylysine glucosidase
MKQSFLKFLLLPGVLVLFSCFGEKKDPIDRFALLTRHNINNSVIDSLNSLSVGNGEFTYTVDITGLQSFPGSYEKGIPLGTMSEWGWHSDLNPQNYNISDVYRSYDVHGKPVEYVHQFRPSDGERKGAATEWLRANPQRAHLGMIGLELIKKDGSSAVITDISDNQQSLYLATGTIESTFSVEGEKVHVITVCHPEKDMVSAKIESGLIKEGRLNLKISFPASIGAWSGYDFKSPEKHNTRILSEDGESAIFERIQDSDRYYVNLLSTGGALKEVAKHEFIVTPSTADSVFEFSCLFSKEKVEAKPDKFDSVHEASRKGWENFWMNGGVVDFSGCSDPRAFELERRVILSQYLTKIQCSGSLPPAETGLTYNSWFGKFHLEMHWWHVVHFGLWQREEILEKQMAYYSHIFENARNTARHQGYRGARWPKMTDPDGRESPSNVGTYLIWQQPHPIFFAELLYENAENKKEILNRYRDIVFETADFMASYAWLDTLTNKYVLGPVLIPAQESLNKETTINPPFETVYWYWGLKTAIEWKKRLGEKPVREWADVIRKIPALAVQDDLYLCSQDTKDSYTNPKYMSDHPIVAAISGMMPETKLIDREILGNSLDTIMKKWNWRSTWGWDFPMLAMSAASIGRGEQAIDFLMMEAPKNRYLLNGHNYQDGRLTIYLPGNGGLLTAVARMCVEDQFPHNGKWNVRWENLNKYVR